jgi:hypothetical protein
MENNVPDLSHLTGENDEIGFSFKKLKKRLKKNPFINPLATVKALKKSPLINPIATVKALRKNPLRSAALMAVGIPAPAVALLRRSKKNPVARAKLAKVRELASQGNAEAQAAAENLEYASEYDSGDYQSPEMEAAVEDYSEEVYEEYPPEFEEEPVDVMGFSFKKAIRKVGHLTDFTKKDNPLRKAMQANPYTAALVKAGDLVASANKGAKKAKEQIKAVSDAAKTGDPNALAAAQNIATADKLIAAQENAAARKPLSWFPGINLYRDGVRKPVNVK